MATTATATSNGKMTTKGLQKTMYEKLFTHEDVFNVHKILGFSALASYIYRYAHFGESDCNFGPTFGTLFFIVHHFFLNASSFIFKIPERRIRGGYRIWPEYRIHSLVFATRSLACMLLMWYEQVMGVTEPYYNLNTVIVLLTCAAADYGSYIQKHQSPTIRNVDYMIEGKIAASVFQFMATAACLMGGRRYSYQMNNVCIIQLNAFFMTLRRKNIGSQLVWMTIYGVMLFGGLVLGAWDGLKETHFIPSAVVGCLAASLRLGPLHVNKYILWSGLGLALHFIRVTKIVEIDSNPFWWTALGVTQVMLVLTMIWKRWNYEQTLLIDVKSEKKQN